MTVLECTADNQAEFPAVLRADPDLHAFVAAFHQAGLIDGLRHIRIAPLAETLPRAPGAVQPVLPAATETRLADLEWKQKTMQKHAHMA